MPLRDRLRTQRDTHGWTQDYVAKQLHVTRSAYTKWENGTHDPNMEQLAALATLFAVTPHWLMGWPDAESEDYAPRAERPPVDPGIWHGLLQTLQTTADDLRENTRRQTDLEEKRLTIEALGRRAEADRAVAERNIGEAANKAQDNFRFLAEHLVTLSHDSSSPDEAEAVSR